MNEVFRTIPHVEKVFVDNMVLSDLAKKLGEVGADQSVTHALEQSLASLCSMQKAMALGKTQDLIAVADHLVEVAQNVGMTTYAKVARDVRDCALAENHVALASTMARLHRIGDRSILAVWGLEDLSV